MSSAICFNLDQSKYLSSVNGLKVVSYNRWSLNKGVPSKDPRECGR